MLYQTCLSLSLSLSLLSPLLCRAQDRAPSAQSAAQPPTQLTETLHELCASPDVSEQRLAAHLTQRKSALNVQNAYGNTPLQLLLRNPHATRRQIEMLVDAGAHISYHDLRDTEHTPYHYWLGLLPELFYQKNIAWEKIQFLQDSGVSGLNERYHPYMRLCRHPEVSVELLRGFLHWGGELDGYAHELAKNPLASPEMFDLLQQHGASPYSEHARGYDASIEALTTLKAPIANALHLFKTTGSPRYCTPARFKWLLERDRMTVETLPYFLTSTTQPLSQTDLVTLICRSTRPRADLLKIALESPQYAHADVEQLSYWLSALCQNAHSEGDALRLLIEKGATLQLPDNEWNELFLVARNTKHLSAIKALVELGRDIKAINKFGDTLLMKLCANPHITAEMLAYMLEQGLDVKQRCHGQKSALHYLCSNPAATVPTLKMLAKAGADLQERDSKDFSLLDRYIASVHAASNWRLHVPYDLDVIAYFCEQGIELTVEPLRTELIRRLRDRKDYIARAPEILQQLKAESETTDSYQRRRFDAMARLDVADRFQYAHAQYKQIPEGVDKKQALLHILTKLRRTGFRTGYIEMSLAFLIEQMESSDSRVVEALERELDTLDLQKPTAAMPVLLRLGSALPVGYGYNLVLAIITNKALREDPALLAACQPWLDGILPPSYQQNLVAHLYKIPALNDEWLQNLKLNATERSGTLETLSRRDDVSLELLSALLERGATLTVPAVLNLLRGTQRSADLLEFFRKHPAPIKGSADIWLAALAREDVHEPLIAYLIEQGAYDTSSSPSLGVDTLQTACSNVAMTAELLEPLLGLGMDIHASNKAGNTALLHASRYASDPRIISLLLERGANLHVMNQYGDSVLSKMLANRRLSAEEMKQLVDGRVDISQLSEHPDSLKKLVWRAYLNRQIEHLRLFHQWGIPMDVGTQRGNTLLHRICRYGESSTYIQAFLDMGFDVHAKNKWGETPLHKLCANELIHPDALRLLLDKGADTGIVSQGSNTALHLLAKNPNVTDQAIELLLAKGADVHAKDAQGNTALHLIARHARAERQQAILSRLLRAGAKARELNAKGESPLTILAKYRALPLAAPHIKILLDAGAAPLQPDESGQTALGYLCRKPMLSPELLAQMLAKLPSMKDAENKKRLSDCLFLIESHQRRNRVQAIEALVKAGADVNALNSLGRSLIVLTLGEQEMTKKLLALKASLKPLAPLGHTPLMYAAMGAQTHPEMLQQLIKAGSAINAVNKAGNSALLHAARHAPSVAVLRSLLDAGADPNVRNQHGDSVIIKLLSNWAIDQVAALEQLIAHGLKLDAVADELVDLFPKLLSTRHRPLLKRLLTTSKIAQCVDTRGRNLLLHHLQSPRLDRELIKLLLERGSDASQRDHDGYTPLAYLIAHPDGDESLIQLLVQHGASLSADSTRALARYMRRPDPEESMVRRLLEQGANPYWIDEQRAIALVRINPETHPTLAELMQQNLSAQAQAQLELARLLTDKHTAKQLTAAIHAMQQKKIPLRDVQGKNGQDLLTSICASPALTPELLKLVYDQVGMPRATTQYYQTHPLHTLAANPNASHRMMRDMLAKMSPELLRKPCMEQNRHAVDYYVSRSLWSAEMVLELLRAGALPEMRDRSGEQSLAARLLSREMLTPELLQAIQKAGFAISRSYFSGGWTILSRHCWTKHHAKPLRAADIQLLLEARVDPNKLNTYSYGALHEACTRKDLDADIIDLFVKHGTMINLPTPDGRTALDIAIGTGNQAVIERLKRYGAISKKN